VQVRNSQERSRTVKNGQDPFVTCRFVRTAGGAIASCTWLGRPRARRRCAVSTGCVPLVSPSNPCDCSPFLFLKTVLPEEPTDHIGETIGNYRLTGLLGRGGMGVVYRGEHVYIGKVAAVKVLFPRFASRDEAVKRFLREAWAASSIKHPNIVDVLDFGESSDGSVFLVMEYASGQGLDTILSQEGRLPLLRAITIMNQVSSALGAAHAAGILHRDLKPENLIVHRRKGRRQLIRRAPGVDEGGVPEPEGLFDFAKVLDFGVAKILSVRPDPSVSSSGLPALPSAIEPCGETDDVLGTPEYMAPEAIRGESVDARADVYAAGVMLYEMLTGSLPIRGNTAEEILMGQLEQPIESPRHRAPEAEITVGIERVILRALQKDPQLRQPSMDVFYDELQSGYGVLRYRRSTYRRRRPPSSGPQETHQPPPMPLMKLKEPLPNPANAPVPIPLTRRKDDRTNKAEVSRPVSTEGEAPLVPKSEKTDGTAALWLPTPRPRRKTARFGRKR